MGVPGSDFRSAFGQAPLKERNLTRMRAMRDFSPLQFANLWQTCLPSPSGRSVNFFCEARLPPRPPGLHLGFLQGCLESSART